MTGEMDYVHVFALAIILIIFTLTADTIQKYKEEAMTDTERVLAQELDRARTQIDELEIEIMKLRHRISELEQGTHE